MTNTKQENTLENSVNNIYANESNSLEMFRSLLSEVASNYSDAKKDLLNYSKSNSDYYSSSFYRTFI